jgi:uncharacterized protein involved in outer membrane biogenesis
MRADAPYGFRFEEHSNDAHLSGSGSILRPFDFARLDVDFEARGPDLRDAYYLAGVRMPHTGPFTASGRLLRRGLRIEFRDLQLRSGESDLGGSYVSERSGDRPRFTAELQSRRMRAADLGERGKPRRQRLFPDTPIPLEGLRRRDGTVTYRADELVAGPLTLRGVDARARVDGGVLTVDPLGAATGGGGRLDGELRFAAEPGTDTPGARLALRFEGLATGELFPGKDATPPLEAPLSGTVALQGEGRSLHDLAAGASGQLTAALSQGTMRASLAESLGLDFRAVGLRMSGAQQTLTLRCAEAHLEAADGKLVARNLMLDTEPVVVRGEGSIDLRTEALDLRFRGQPKQMRLRLRTALEIRGTLADPAPRIEEGRTTAQAGAAVALGALVTPLAAAVAFVDPGRAKDQDCAALLAKGR